MTTLTQISVKTSKNIELELRSQTLYTCRVCSRFFNPGKTAQIRITVDQGGVLRVNLVQLYICRISPSSVAGPELR